MGRGLLQIYGTSSNFTPANLTSTKSWWDWSDISTITAVGTDLHQTNDKIGNFAPMQTTEPFTTYMNWGLRTVSGLNVASMIHSGNVPYQSMLAPNWATGWPGAEGTIYVVAVCEQSWDGQTPFIFGVRDVYPVTTKAIELISEDHYHLYFYPSAYINNVALSRHGIESFSSFMDGLPHVYKISWSVSQNKASLTGDGGLLFPTANGTGYTDFGSTTYGGPEIGTIGTFGNSVGTMQICEMTIHNQYIADGSPEDLAMLKYFRNKWKTLGATLSTTTTTRQGALSAGTILNAVSIANDGTLFIAPSNNPNCFRWNSGVNSRFDNVFAQTRVPTAAQAWGQGAPLCLDLAVAPSNSSIVYAVVASLGSTTVWKSTDSGTTWTDTAHAVPFSAAPGAGPCVAIDPSDPTKVLIGCSNGHVHQSTNSGTSWTDRTITGGGTSYPCIVFESTTSIYLGWLAGATNVLHSSDSGATFSSPASSGPTTVRGLCVSADGVVYSCDNGGGTTNSWKLSSATWSNFTGGQITATAGTWAFPAAEGSAGHVAFCSTTGLLQYSANYGVAWQYGTSPGTPQTQSGTVNNYNLDSSGDVAWLVSPSLGDLFNGGVRPPNLGCANSYACSRILFDPSSSGKLWLTCATGLYYVTPATYNGVTTPAIDWWQQNKNQQGLQINDICRVPIQSNLMNNMLFVCQGKSGATPNAPRTEPTFMVGGPLSDNGLCCDYAKNSTLFQFIVTTAALWKSIDFGADGFCASDGVTNMGAVTGIDSKPMMAVVNDTTLCVLSGTGKKFTSTAVTNSTPTWSDCTGLPAGSASNGRSHVLVNDAVTATTLYALIPSNGVYTSTNSGSSWTQQTASSAALPSSYAQGSQLSATPGQTGHLWFAGGNTGALPLARSTDGGVTWSALSSVTEAWQVSVGKIKSGASYPTIFITGKIVGDSDPGVFRSTDTAVTWTRVSRAPGGNLDAPNKLFADLDNYGTFFVSMGTTGYCFGELDYA